MIKVEFTKTKHGWWEVNYNAQVHYYPSKERALRGLWREALRNMNRFVLTIEGQMNNYGKKTAK